MSPWVTARRVGWLCWSGYYAAGMRLLGDVGPPVGPWMEMGTTNWVFAGTARTRWGAHRKARRAGVDSDWSPYIVRDRHGRPTRVQVPGVATIALVRPRRGPVTAADIVTVRPGVALVRGARVEIGPATIPIPSQHTPPVDRKVGTPSQPSGGAK